MIKSWKNIIIAVVLVAVVGGGIYALTRETAPIIIENGQSQANIVEYNGSRYRYNTDLTNILFIGIDSNDLIQKEEYGNYTNQADSIILLSLDKSTKKAKMLQISRNSMVDIDLYDIHGNVIGTSFAQLCLQYSVAKGGTQSCWAMVNTVSTMLNDLRIDGYLNLNIESIGIINDAVGGVTLTIPEDYTDIEPEFVAGETLNLTAHQAERYVRGRVIEGIGGNEERMERQVQYLSALVNTVKSKNLDNLYDTFSTMLDDYVMTDLTGEQIDDLSDYDVDFTKTAFVPGEKQMGDTYEEFYIDEQKMDDILIEMFYNEVN